jgi:hypothetical protein
MKMFLNIVLVSLATAANSLRGSEASLSDLAKSNKPTFDQIMLFIDGFMEGMGEDLRVDSMHNCIYFSSDSRRWFEQAIKDFSMDTLEGYQNGFSDLAKASDDIPAAVRECQPAFAQVSDMIGRAINALSDPLNVIHNVEINFYYHSYEIFNGISQAIGFYRNQDWFNSGKSIGEALFKIIYIPPAQI